MRLVVLALVAYPWLAGEPAHGTSVGSRIAPPPGFTREAPDPFAAWLRGLPLLPGRPAVMLHDGRPKANQDAHHAVVDLDVGRKDLQQCADAVIRLRAEYLFSAGRAAEVVFDATSGDPMPFARWRAGERPVVSGQRLRWVAGRAAPDATYGAFRRYLDVVFTYAGSASLARELVAVPGSAVAAGDVFVQGGFPGHAVIVVDVAHDPRTDRRRFLLAQSYMPAQQLHVLRSPGRADPWYELVAGHTLVTPEWTFHPGDRRRFRER